jgi:hypothetical protein
MELRGGIREVTTMTRPWKHHGITVIHVDQLPGHSNLEGGYTEYADAVRIRAIDEDTGAVSLWSTLPVRDGWVDVNWVELWEPPPCNQPTAA